MGKIVGFVLLLCVLPLGIAALVVVAISLRFHAATDPCIATSHAGVVVVQSKYVDLQVPTSTCLERYKG